MGGKIAPPMATCKSDVERKPGFGVVLVCDACNGKGSPYCKLEVGALPKMGVNRVRCPIGGYEAVWQRIK